MKRYKLKLMQKIKNMIIAIYIRTELEDVRYYERKLKKPISIMKQIECL